MAITPMNPSETPGESGEDALKAAVSGAAKSAGRFFSRLRQEYREGLAGDSEKAQPPAAPVESRPKARRWWEVLGVRDNASLADITTAYRELLRKTHPDKVAQLSDRLRQVAEEETLELNAAYEEARRAVAPVKNIEPHS